MKRFITYWLYSLKQKEESPMIKYSSLAEYKHNTDKTEKSQAGVEEKCAKKLKS